MPLRVLTVLGIAVGAISWAAHAYALVVITVALLGYLGSLVIAPKRKCRSCGGAKVHPDVLGSKGVRRCGTCSGHGEYSRWGTMLLRPQVHAQIRNGKHGRNY